MPIGSTTRPSPWCRNRSHARAQFFDNLKRASGAGSLRAPQHPSPSTLHPIPLSLCTAHPAAENEPSAPGGDSPAPKRTQWPRAGPPSAPKTNPVLPDRAVVIAENEPKPGGEAAAPKTNPDRPRLPRRKRTQSLESRPRRKRTQIAPVGRAENEPRFDHKSFGLPQIESATAALRLRLAENGVPGKIRRLASNLAVRPR